MQHRSKSQPVPGPQVIPAGQAVPPPLYDVLLGGRPPESLRERFPTMSIRATRAQTALRRRVSGPRQLDALLEQLRSLGVRLLDVHRLPTTEGEEQTYEVRVDGEVGETLLQYLNWSHQVVPEQVRVRVATASSDLHEFLRACTESGASVHRVRLVHLAQRSEPACS